MCSRNSLIKTIDQIIEIGYLLIIGLTPLVLNIFSYNVFLLNQTVLFQILTEITFLFWLIKIILAEESIKKLFLTKIKFILPALIFIAILGLTVIFAQAPGRSLLGSYERKMGYLTWLHFLAFFLILIFNLTSWARIKRVILIILITTALVCLYAFTQLSGFDPINWLEPPLQTKRVFSTFGQPNFLGAWLLFIIPLIIFSFFIWQKFLNRFFLILLLGSTIFIFISTLSRAAWLGLIGEIFFFLIIFAWVKRKKWPLRGVLVSILLSLLILILINFYPPYYSTAPNAFERLKSLAYLKQGSSQIRFWWWTDALKLIKEKPILGYGLENQRLIYHYYYRPEVALYEKINTYPDRAHNEFLDLLLTAGIIGLLSYLFLIINVFWLGLKKMKQSLSSGFKVYGLWFMILTGLFGYLISNQFSFPVISTALYFWLFIALITYEFTKSYESTKNNI